MSRFGKEHLIVAANVAALVITVSIALNSRQAVAQDPNGPQVTINPAQLPLPVTGSTTVSGNVGITGQPIQVRNVDEPARNGFLVTVPNLNNSQATINVPGTQRWVIENYSAFCNEDVSDKLTDIGILQGGFDAASTAPHFVQANGSLNGHNVNFWTGSALTSLYFGPNATIVLQASDSSATANIIGPCGFSISGYAVNLP